MFKKASIKKIKLLRTVSLMLSGALYTADMIIYPTDIMAKSYHYAKLTGIYLRIAILVMLAISLLIFIVSQFKVMMHEWRAQ